MKHLVFFLAFTLASSFASAVSLQLQCEFRPGSNLKGFIAEIDEQTAYLQFEGDSVTNSLMNPAGEKVTLERRRPFTANWMIYSGKKEFPHLAKAGCFIFENGNCLYPSRGYDMNISPAALLRPGQRSGSLSFTKISDFLPGEAYYSHDIFCTEIR